MAKTTTSYWNPLTAENDRRWTPVQGLEGMAEELTLSMDSRTGEYTRLTRFLPGQSSEVGRVRHLYVDPEFRRRGVGRSLVLKIVECASRSFVRLRLRTFRADADLFYVALGFRRVVGEPEVTHEIEALPSTGSA